MGPKIIPFDKKKRNQKRKNNKQHTHAKTSSRKSYNVKENAADEYKYTNTYTYIDKKIHLHFLSYRSQIDQFFIFFFSLLLHIFFSYYLLIFPFVVFVFYGYF